MAQEEPKKHPVALMEMDDQDREFTHIDKKGRSPKFFVEALDSEKFFFTTEAAAEQFMDEHGMIAVNDQELQQAREEQGYA